MTAMYFIYSLGLGMWLVLGSPFWIYQMLRHGKYRASLAARLGRVPDHIKQPGTRPVIWVHAVSVGEVLAIADVAQELRRGIRIAGWCFRPRLTRARCWPENASEQRTFFIFRST